jgi:3-oxoacyl-[acyl-carrier protein] reductase
LPPSAPVPPRVAVVTGAAGLLGRALVAALVAAGWRVTAAGHAAPPAAPGPEVFAARCDVTDAAAVGALVEETVARWGRLDAFIANAGVVRDATLPRLTVADWDAVLGVNLRGAFLGARAALRPMLRQRDGHLVFIGSFAARGGGAGRSAYAAAKAGLIGLAQSLAQEVGGRNLRVNVVLPGVLPGGLSAGLTDEQLAALAAPNALRRLNDPAEVARLVTALLDTRDVSGQVLALDSRVARWA